MVVARSNILVAAAVLLAFPVARAADPVPARAPAPEPPEVRAAHERMPDTPGSGRFPAIKEQTNAPPELVVYRPARLDALGGTRLGIYVFGNGGCVADGASSRLHLLEVASHGYLVVAPGRILSGPGAPAASGAPAGGAAQRRTNAADFAAALDWAVRQNADPKSPFFGRVDPAAVAVSGYSCGGAQALRAAADPRVKAVVLMNSGIPNTPLPVPAGMEEMNAPKSLLRSLQTPILYIVGDDSDVAHPNAMDDFARIEHVPVFVASLKGVPHAGTYWDPNGGKGAAVAVAWLEWQLRGDRRAARLFSGKACGLCRDPAWVVSRKRMD